MNQAKKVREAVMTRILCYFVVIASVTVLGLGTPAHAQDEPDRLRGVITEVDGATMVMETTDGKTIHLGIPDYITVFSLTEARFEDLEFGAYIGAANVQLTGERHSPFIRDSASWLHEGFELRIIDEDIRGIALGHTPWDLPNRSTEASVAETSMTHGWIDDIELRTVMIKYGPTPEEETDVEFNEEVPVVRMAIGESDLIKPGVRVLVGAQNDEDDNYVAVFAFIGVNGVVPGM